MRAGSVFYGSAGVSLFFALSGAALTYSGAGRLKGPRLLLAASWVSRYSYGIFLCHHLVLQQMCVQWEGKGFSTNELACLLLIVLLAVGFAAVLVTKGGRAWPGLSVRRPVPQRGLKGASVRRATCALCLPQNVPVDRLIKHLPDLFRLPGLPQNPHDLGYSRLQGHVVGL